jgi:hypothetical protein
MGFIPGRSLLLALLAPLSLALVTVAEPATLPALLITDGVILALALLDLLLVLKPGVVVQRELPETVSLARPFTVTLEVKNNLRRKLLVELNEGLFLHAEAEGLPLRMEVEAGVVRRGRTSSRPWSGAPKRSVNTGSVIDPPRAFGFGNSSCKPKAPSASFPTCRRSVTTNFWPARTGI